MSLEHSQSSHASIRILHNIGPNLGYLPPQVDVYLGNKAIAYNLSYKDFTAYTSVNSGTHILTVKDVNTNTPIIQSKVHLSGNTSYTAVIAGNVSESQYNKIIINKDNLQCPRPGSSLLRFIYGAGGITSYDIYSNNTLLFSNVSYGQTTAYSELPPGYANINIRVAGTTGGAVTPIVNPFLVSGGIYDIILSLDPTPIGIVADNLQSRCEKLQENFDGSKFSGKWHVIASIPLSQTDYCPRATVEYTKLQNEYKILSKCFDDDWIPLGSNLGTGAPPDAFVPAAWRVSYEGNTGTGPSGANYLIHRTDYVNYSINGTPNRSYVWILSRHPKITQERYQHLVRYVASLGYDINQLKIKYHAIVYKCDKPSNEKKESRHEHTHSEKDQTEIIESKISRSKISASKVSRSKISGSVVSGSESQREYPDKDEAEWVSVNIKDLKNFKV